MHIPSYLAAFAEIAALAAASPPSYGKSGRQNPPGSGLQNFLVNYNFETFTSVLGQIPTSVNVIGDYDLLNFNTILVNQSIPATGVKCHTPPACTAFTLSSSLLSVLLNPNGLLTGLLDHPDRLTGPAVVTADYQYSPISYFTPYLFYYGCVVADLNGAASVPVDCTITATGFNTGGHKVYSQDFNYKTNGNLLGDMTVGYFNQGWSGLQVKRLELTVSNNATTAALFDNFLATVHGPQNAATTIDF